MGALIIIPTILAICATFWALLIGIHALLHRRGYSGEYAGILALLGINLCEPVVNATLVTLLFAVPTVAFHARPVHALASTFPMVVLILPAACTSFSNSVYQHYRRILLILGAARWVVSWGMLTTYLYGHVISLILLLLGTMLLLWCAAWGQSVLQGPLAYPRLAPSPPLELTSSETTRDS